MHKKVLVVDDENEIREIVTDVLNTEGYEVESAASGEEGIEKAQEKQFDIALLDVRLGGQDGIVTYWQLKRVSPRTKAIIMTAHYKREELSFCIDNHVDTYLQKPFEIDTLVDLVNGL